MKNGGSKQNFVHFSLPFGRWSSVYNLQALSTE